MGLYILKRVISMADDIFAELDEELDQMKTMIIEDIDKLNAQKTEITKSLIEYFWQVWIRFDRIKVHFSMDPNVQLFAIFKEYPEKWRFKDNFNFSDIDTIKITDKTQAGGRLGDKLEARFYHVDKNVHLRITFEYCDGEHYYKYSGWKRIFAQNIIYDAPIEKVKMNKIWDLISDMVKTWFESHLRRNRDMIIKYVKENFDKGETFTS
jgi:hypothetical protein